MFWDAVHDLDPAAPGEAELPGTREGHLTELAEAAGLLDVHASVLTVALSFAGVDEWWEPFTLGVGPAGAYVAGLDVERRDALRVRCGELLPDGPLRADGVGLVGDRGRTGLTASTTDGQVGA